MPEFHYYHPIEVRYGDLDPQGHVNNAKYLTYLETGRIAYFRNLKLWVAESFLDLGVILADIRITFLAPILYGQPVQVGVRVTRLGNKSLDMVHVIRDADTGKEMATGSSVLVAYDYHSGASVSIPDEWRVKIRAFEKMSDS